MTMPTLSPVAAVDFDDMVALRIAALRPSLERLGRFDPVRAREWLAAGFQPEYMQHIALAGQRIGFITLSALKHSDASRFYLRHGFVQVGGSEFDMDYRWQQAQGALV
jgi:hypothetical protein